VFTMTIDNQSGLVLEEVVFPWLGDVRPSRESGRLDAVSYRYAGMTRRGLRPEFRNVPGYYGVDRPTYLNEGEGTVGAPVSPFILLENGSRGLYVAVDEPSSELVAWHAELHPGWGDSILHTIPQTSVRSPEPVSVRFGVAHVPYLPSGERRTLTPVAMASYTGDWHAGADLYIQRRDTWMGAAVAPEWAAGPDAWLQLHINSPEDELRMMFSELPQVARSCARNGVAVIQLVGWNVGGQDRDNPSHKADPRLGGTEELRRAIAACQAEGVRVVLFTKFTWADRSTDRFRTSLIGDAVKDPYGDYYLHHGYRYQTMTQLLDISTRRLVPMCFASRHYQDIATADLSHVLDLGADGMLFDESLHHTPALLCFDGSHGHRLGHPVYAEDRELVHRFRSAAGTRDRDFLYAGEACYDWEFEVYGLSYHRSDSSDHVPLSRYLRPHAQLMTAVTGFDDRNMVNQALMYRYLLSYEPYNFKGRLEDFPDTVAYGARMDALRTAFRHWFWDGTFRDTVGATVLLEDGHAAPHFAVFQAGGIADVGVVVANQSAEDGIRVSVRPDGTDTRLSYRLVDDATWHDAEPWVVVPPRSAAVLIPTDALREMRAAGRAPFSA
ncbi:MAG: DUF6259 domain-containing protein, partial [Chloroflexi bacterium]|nr:DUF6259 domain-containing protein [Chloroflexota bacterium]